MKYWYRLQHGGTSKTYASARSQTEKIMYYIVPFTWNIQNKSRDKKQVSGCQEVEERNGELLIGKGFLLWWGKCLRPVMGLQNIECTKCHCIVHLKMVNGSFYVNFSLKNVELREPFSSVKCLSHLILTAIPVKVDLLSLRLNSNFLPTQSVHSPNSILEEVHKLCLITENQVTC